MMMLSFVMAAVMMLVMLVAVVMMMVTVMTAGAALSRLPRAAAYAHRHTDPCARSTRPVRRAATGASVAASRAVLRCAITLASCSQAHRHANSAHNTLLSFVLPPMLLIIRGRVLMMSISL